MADRFLSLPYLFLRSSTAGGALLFGLIQTFVFARVLSPERFSVFILIGTLGITLWLVDFGLTRILFVRQREAFLAGRKDPVIAGQSMAVMMRLRGRRLCRHDRLRCRHGRVVDAPLLDAIEFALFFLFRRSIWSGLSCASSASRSISSSSSKCTNPSAASAISD